MLRTSMAAVAAAPAASTASAAPPDRERPGAFEPFVDPPGVACPEAVAASILRAPPGRLRGARVVTAARWPLAALVALLVAGCGGEAAGDDEAPVAAAQTSQSRFVARADAICAEANAAESALGAPGAGFMYTEQFDDPRFLAEFTRISAAALDDLRGLEVPPGKEGPAATALGAIERMLGALEQRTADLSAGRDKRRAEQVNAYNTGYGDLAAAAGRLGWSECQGLLL